jgi:hypothetical protein
LKGLILDQEVNARVAESYNPGLHSKSIPVEVDINGTDINQEILGAGFAFKMLSPLPASGPAPRGSKPDQSIGRRPETTNQSAGRRPEPTNQSAFGKGRQQRTNDVSQQWQSSGADRSLGGHSAFKINLDTSWDNDTPQKMQNK